VHGPAQQGVSFGRSAHRLEASLRKQPGIAINGLGLALIGPRSHRHIGPQ
jgi:hypothetical protein